MREYRGKSVLSIEELNAKEIPHRNGWVHGWYVDGWIVGNYADSDDEWIAFEWWSQAIPETVGQFTGLKDKNGVEIYEGDVIKTHFSFSHEVAQEPFIIQWNKDKAMFEGVKKNPEQDEYLRSFSFFPEQLFIYEVIGNIHDQAGDE